MSRNRKTKEEVVANKIIDMVSDVTLDLDNVGEYVADNSPSVLYNRLEVVMESARERKENVYNGTDWNAF
jgi:hypothetical protein